MVAVADDSSGFAAVMIWPSNLVKLAADLADHQVPRDEADMRVDGIDVPGAGDVAGDIDSLCRHGVSLVPRRE